MPSSNYALDRLYMLYPIPRPVQDVLMGGFPPDSYVVGNDDESLWLCGSSALVLPTDDWP
ncbi:MAG: hypothetical protein AB7S50_04035 [Bacteroidales bacterium]